MTYATVAFHAANPTYWSLFEELSAYDAHLNYTERLWAAWYAFMENDALATGLMSAGDNRICMVR